MRPVRVSRRARPMNRTEAEYAKYLDTLRAAGRIREWHFEALTLALGHDCRFTPDFFVVTTEGEAELREVKGFWRDDAKAKVKMCARLYPFRILVARATKGDWTHEEVKP